MNVFILFFLITSSTLANSTLDISDESFKDGSFINDAYQYIFENGEFNQNNFDLLYSSYGNQLKKRGYSQKELFLKISIGENIYQNGFGHKGVEQVELSDSSIQNLAQFAQKFGLDSNEVIEGISAYRKNTQLVYEDRVDEEGTPYKKFSKRSPLEPQKIDEYLDSSNAFMKSIAIRHLVSQANDEKSFTRLIDIIESNDDIPLNQTQLYYAFLRAKERSSLSYSDLFSLARKLKPNESLESIAGFDHSFGASCAQAISTVMSVSGKNPLSWGRDIVKDTIDTLKIFKEAGHDLSTDCGGQSIMNVLSVYSYDDEINELLKEIDPNYVSLYEKGKRAHTGCSTNKLQDVFNNSLPCETGAILTRLYNDLRKAGKHHIVSGVKAGSDDGDCEAFFEIHEDSNGLNIDIRLVTGKGFLFYQERSLDKENVFEILEAEFSKMYGN